MRISRLRFCVWLLAVGGLVSAFNACAAHTVAAVQDKGAPARQPQASVREVQSGDTLYSIAWESGLDYRDIARWNDLEPPFVIQLGQKIRLVPPQSGKQPAPARSGSRIVSRGDTLYSIAKAAGLSVSDLAAWNGLSPPYRIAPGQRLRLTPPTGASARASRPPPERDPKSKIVEATEGSGPIAWRWPADGKIIARFAPDDGAKGIDIAGLSGQAIYAAAPGKVVYQGSGLRGYGQLIIVKHNVDFLSAYAHCAAIYVREGSVIQPGQKIAAMGSSGADRAMLHFEIRRRGVPVNPLDHLPKK